MSSLVSSDLDIRHAYTETLPFTGTLTFVDAKTSSLAKTRLEGSSNSTITSPLPENTKDVSPPQPPAPPSSPSTPAPTAHAFLRQYRTEESVPVLLQMLERKSKESGNRFLIPIALGLIATQRAFEALQLLVRNSDPSSCLLGAVGLCYIVSKDDTNLSKKAFIALMPVLLSGNKGILEAMADALGNTRSKHAIGLLKLLLETPYLEVRVAAAAALGNIEDEAAKEQLWELARAVEGVDSSITTFNDIIERTYGIKNAYAYPQAIKDAPRHLILNCIKRVTLQQIEGLRLARESAKAVCRAAREALERM